MVRAGGVSSFLVPLEEAVYSVQWQFGCQSADFPQFQNNVGALQ